MASVFPPATRKIEYPAKSDNFVVPLPSAQATDIVPNGSVAPPAGEVTITSAIAKDTKVVIRERDRMNIVVKGRSRVNRSRP